MVIPDEVRALQLEKAEAVERQWSALQIMAQERLAGHKELQVMIDAKSRKTRARPPILAAT
jgi:hypothetical protein